MLILPYTSESWGVESMLYNSKYHVSTTSVSFSLHKRYTALPRITQWLPESPINTLKPMLTWKPMMND